MPRTSNPGLWRACGVALLLAPGAGGCVPEVPLAPVEGVVTKAGKPVAKVEVIFMTDGGTAGPRARATTDAQGRYQLRTDTGMEGAPVGPHRVCLIDQAHAAEQTLAAGIMNASTKMLQNAKADKLGGRPVAQSRIPPQYGRPAETPLRADVQRGPQTVNFEIP